MPYGKCTVCEVAPSQRGANFILLKWLIMDEHQVKQIIDSAIAKLIENDAELLDINVSERALMFHLARYIHELTPVEFNVDCEYNRHLKDPKSLLFAKNASGVDAGHKVLPDILIHIRNSDEKNLLVIEIKKPEVNFDEDIKRLKAFKKEPYSYTFAALVIIGNVGTKPISEIQWV